MLGDSEITVMKLLGRLVFDIQIVSKFIYLSLEI